MRRPKVKQLITFSACSSLLLAGIVTGSDTKTAHLNVVPAARNSSGNVKPDIIQVQDQPPSLTDSPSSDSGAGASRRGGVVEPGQSIPAPGNTGSDTNSRASDTSNSSGAGATSVNASGGQAASAVNAGDVGEFLSKSSNSVGVDIQQRNGVSADPRVRGYRVGQLVTMGDGAFYFPVRQDLDTAISKFDPSSVRDIIVYRGPYTSLYGPGFSFLDIATLDSPRFECGFETHGRTGGRYQTNGKQWDGIQSVSMGDRDWGLRLTYNFLQGNDYLAGEGIQVANSYLSHNVNMALGFDLSDKSSIEFKILRVHQENLEFPGLYFDIKQLDTEAYSVRYTLRDQRMFDRMYLDAWYNTTVADGFTAPAAKQSFVRRLLNVSFNEDPDPPYFNSFTDQSTSHMSNKSLGSRVSFLWGGSKGGPTLIAGADISILGQNLVENIRFTQVSGDNINTGVPVSQSDNNVFTQTQTIPNTSLVNPGLFTELTLPFGEQLKVRAGGRFDIVNTTSGSRLITGNINIFGPPQTLPDPITTLDPIEYSTDPTNNNLTRNFQLFSGFLTGDFRIDEYNTLSAGYAHAMRAPTLTELYAAGPFLGVLQQGTSRLIGDPHLDPETLNQFDLGLRSDFGWFKGSITGFYAFVDNYITYDENKGGDGINQIVVTNTNLATLAGFEMYGQVEASRSLTLFSGGSFVQGTDRSHRDNRRPEDIASSRRNDPATAQYAVATEALPQIPPLEVFFGMRLHEAVDNNKAPRWAVELGARKVYSQYNVAYSLNEKPTSGFTTYDIRTYWQVSDAVLLTAGVENIGNILYREHLDPISGNLIGVGPFYRPGSNFYFGTQVTY
ncbi:MAG: TonB-dependent receptor [Planctomycetia bacterium]|nr:TonB-dependent receptor [Planctomycetia bacterium]